MYWTFKRILVCGLAGFFITFILFYAHYQSRGIMKGPQIILESPLNGRTVTTALVSLRGTTIHAKEITLNGRAIFIDTTGRFNEELLLAEGYNIIELTAKDTGGAEIQKTLELVYQKEKEAESSQATSTTQEEDTQPKEE